MDNIDLLEAIEPQIPGYERSGTEPCLGVLVFQYYREYFTFTKATELTNQYFEALKKELRK